MAHFAGILRGEEAPSVGYVDGVEALAIAEAAGQSAKTGQVVKV